MTQSAHPQISSIIESSMLVCQTPKTHVSLFQTDGRNVCSTHTQTGTRGARGLTVMSPLEAASAKRALAAMRPPSMDAWQVAMTRVSAQAIHKPTTLQAIVIMGETLRKRAISKLPKRGEVRGCGGEPVVVISRDQSREDGRENNARRFLDVVRYGDGQGDLFRVWTPGVRLEAWG